MGHAEVNGLVGQTEGKAIVVERLSDIEKIDFARPIRLYSQTTMSVDAFRQIALEISGKMKNPEDFKFFDTICRQVANRIPHMREFASQHDVVLLVSGKKSSNGKALFEVCKSVNERSYLISHPEDVNIEMLKDVESVGICGATSTPRWQMEEIRQIITKNLNF